MQSSFLQRVCEKLKEKQIDVSYDTIDKVYAAIIAVIRESLVKNKTVLLPKLGTLFIHFPKIKRIKSQIKNGAVEEFDRNPKMKINSSRYIKENVIDEIKQEMRTHAS